MIYSLEIFRAVVEEKGFSDASKKLGLTQSAVSQQIKALEEELGVKLFEKSDRRKLTREGEFLYERSLRVLSELKDIKNSIANIGEIIGGEIKFGMIDVAAIGLLPRILKKFKQKYKDVKMEAEVKPSGELVKSVRDYKLDFCVAVKHDIPDSLECRTFFKDSIVAIVPTNFKLSQRKTISVEDLKGVPLILYPKGSYSRFLIEDVMSKKGVHPSVAMEMHYPAAILSLVAQGMGVGLLSELSARGEMIRDERMVYVKELKEKREIAVIKNKDRDLSVQARALIEMILKES